MSSISTRVRRAAAAASLLLASVAWTPAGWAQTPTQRAVAPAPIAGTVRVTGASPPIVWLHTAVGKSYVITGERAADLAAFAEQGVVVYGTPRAAPDGRDRAYQVIALDRFALGQGDSWIGTVRVQPDGEARSKSVLVIGKEPADVSLTIATFPNESQPAAMARQLDGATVSLWGTPQKGSFSRTAIDFLAKAKIKKVEDGYEVDLLNGHKLTVPAASDASLPVIGTEAENPRWLMLNPTENGLALRWASLPVADRRYADPFAEPYLWQILDATWQQSVAAQVVTFSHQVNGNGLDGQTPGVGGHREDNAPTAPKAGAHPGGNDRQ